MGACPLSVDMVPSGPSVLFYAAAVVFGWLSYKSSALGSPERRERLISHRFAGTRMSPNHTFETGIHLTVSQVRVIEDTGWMYWVEKHLPGGTLRAETVLDVTVDSNDRQEFETPSRGEILGHGWFDDERGTVLRASGRSGTGSVRICVWSTDPDEIRDALLNLVTTVDAVRAGASVTEGLGHRTLRLPVGGHRNDGTCA